MTATRTGYIGGTTDNPTYSSVCSGDGHTEALEVTYRSSEVTYDELVDYFFKNHNAASRQKAQYKSAIYPTSEAQAERAAELVEERRSQGKFVVTEVQAPAQQFWEAEMYHQNYNKVQNVRFGALFLVFALDFLQPSVPGFPAETVRSFLYGCVVLSLVPQFLSMASGVMQPAPKKK